ncbi:hypothetical protein F4677DRAFT_443147 [Hypoxylon crocopeplum]|nr:hypothetical protein F4677DRAFT_443147 [Hypoxylon crocopeplum]
MEEQTNASQSRGTGAATANLHWDDEEENESCFVKRLFQLDFWGLLTTSFFSSKPSSEPSQETDGPSKQKTNTDTIDGTTTTTASTTPPVQTPYVPQHAKKSFLETATPRQMRKANEIL